jgi:hypothetical protein
MNTWNNRGSRELIGHSKHFGTRFALDSVTVYPIIFPDNQGQVRLTQADFYFFIPSIKDIQHKQTNRLHGILCGEEGINR